MTEALLWLLGTGAVLIVAAGYLTQAGDRIAEHSGLGRVWIGSVLLAGATSLPELAVNVSAVRQGAVDLATGDLFGSNMANMLILALLGLIPPRDEIFRRASIDHTLSAGLAILMNVLAAMLIFTGSDALVLGVSLGGLLLLALFVVGSHVVYRQGLGASALGAVTPGKGPRRAPLARAVTHFTAAALVILVVAPVFAHHAEDVAAATGLGSTYFGTLFVGLCTSLPEIVTSVAAVRMRAFDLAVGNLFGSNVFNMSIFFAMDVAAPGSSIFVGLDPNHVFSALAAAGLMALGLASIVFRVERRQALLEPGSVLMILVYLASIVALHDVSVAG